MRRNGLRGAACLAAVMAICGLGLATSVPSGAATPRPASHPPITPAMRYGVVPVHRPGSGPAAHPAPPQGSFPCETTCGLIKMSYFDGPIDSGAKVQDVFWGSGKYTSGGGPGQQMPTFFNDMGASTYWAQLTEYNSDAIVGGTTQAIGPVSSLGETTITPAPGNGGSTITDLEEQHELVADFADGTLPAPEVDSQGLVTTDYALFFPNGKTLKGPPGVGTGGVEWCAYHSTLSYKGLMVPYMVLPAYVPGNPYAFCEDTPTLFGDFTSVVSHETVEAVTDPDIGLDTEAGYAYPAAWGDNNNEVGEVADACDTGLANDYGTVDGFVVQPLWSNRQNACVVGGGRPDLLPAMGSTVSGQPITYSVTNNSGTNVTSSTALSITKLGGGASVGAGCTGDTCTASHPGTYLVKGRVSGGGRTDAGVLSVTAVHAQTITFTSTPPSDATVNGIHYDVAATGGGSGNPVTFSIDSSASAVCSLARGIVVRFTTIGTCIIDANQAAGNGYAAAPQVQQSISVGPDPSEVPVITSFTPTSGWTGSKVVITGSNLGDAVVSFDRVTATVTKDSATKIVTTVPAGAENGFIVVTTPVGGSTSSAKKFKVT